MPRLNQPQVADHPWRKKSCTTYKQMLDAKQAPKKRPPRGVPGSSTRWACPNCGSGTCEYEECLP